MTPLELPDPDLIRQAAILYAQAGYLIFPLWPNKTPRTPNGMKDATTDPATILRWWTQWPEALIGCRIPPHIVVIDVDPKHSGMTTWKALRAQYGDPPATPVHKSGRGDGGGHLWFRRPPGKLSIRPLNQWAKANNVGEAVGNHSWVSGIDLLHHGHRYTILPPSPHPATGEPYRWAEGRHLDDLAPAECPAWLAALITEQPQPIQPTRHLSVVETDSIADWFSQTWSWNDLLIPEGWYRIKGDGDEDGSQWRHPNATTPFSATTRNQCLFVYSPNTDFEPTEQGDPHGYTRFRAYALLAHNGDMTKAARKARELKDGHTSSSRDDDYSWVTLTNGTGSAHTNEPTTTEVTEPMAADEDGLQPINWHQFWTQERPDEDWLCAPLIPTGRQIAIWAYQKVGKSLITLEIAAALATGKPIFGEPTKPTSVIYIDLEMTEEDLYDRLVDMGYGPETNLTNLHYYLLPNLPPLETPAGAETLLALVTQHNAKLVILDTMSRAVNGDENDANTYRAFYKQTGIQLKAAGVAVCRLDHGGKNPDQGQRGSSAKGDDVDVIWHLTPADNDGLLFESVSRVPWVPQTVHMRRVDEPHLHHQIRPDMAIPAGVHNLVLLLDKYAVPVDTSRRRAHDILRSKGHGAKARLLGLAIKSRKGRTNSLEDII